MMVGRDEARHDDGARAIDHFGIGRRDRGRDLRDCLPVDEDVGLFEVADLRVETEDDAAAQQDGPLAAVADQTLSRCLRTRTSTGRCPGTRGGSEGSGVGGRCQERAT